jgi:hypothetical protein
VTQFGLLDRSESPGQPEKVMTFGTSSFWARRTVSRKAASCCLRQGGVGVERVAVAGEGADLQAPAGDRLLEAGERGVVGEQLGRIAVGAAGVAAGADLDRVAARLLDVVERFLERALGEQHREHAYLHLASFGFPAPLAPNAARWRHSRRIIP